MGHSTRYLGRLDINPVLSEPEIEWLRAYAELHDPASHGYDVPLLSSRERFLPTYLRYALLGPRVLQRMTLGLCESSVERLHRSPGEAQRALRQYDDEFYVIRSTPLALGQVQGLPVPGSVEIGDRELELQPAEGHTEEEIEKTLCLAHWKEPNQENDASLRKRKQEKQRAKAKRLKAKSVAELRALNSDDWTEEDLKDYAEACADDAVTAAEMRAEGYTDEQIDEAIGTFWRVDNTEPEPPPKKKSRRKPPNA